MIYIKKDGSTHLDFVKFIDDNFNKHVPDDVFSQQRAMIHILIPNEDYDFFVNAFRSYLDKKLDSYETYCRRFVDNPGPCGYKFSREVPNGPHDDPWADTAVVSVIWSLSRFESYGTIHGTTYEECHILCADKCDDKHIAGIISAYAQESYNSLFIHGNSDTNDFLKGLVDRGVTIK